MGVFDIVIVMAYYQSRRSSSKKMYSSKSNCTIKLTGIPKNLTEEELIRFVSQQSAYSGIVSVTVFEGYALINYSYGTSLETVCSKLDGKYLSGSVLKAKIKGATSSSGQSTEYFTVKITHLSRHVSEDELGSICSRCGIVTSVKLNEGYAYANFRDLASAQNAVDYLNKLTLGGQTVCAKMHQPQDQMSSEPTRESMSIGHGVGSKSLPTPSSNVFCPQSSCTPVSSTVKVELSGPGLTGNDLLHYFMKFGHVEGVPAIKCGKPDYAYVNFSTSDSAKRACKEATTVQLKSVTMTIKLSNKAKIPKIDTQSFMTDDSVVNQLLAKHQFNEIEKKLINFNVTVEPLEAFTGLQVTGSQEDVIKAKILLDTEVEFLKTIIIKESKPFPCSTIPFFSDPKLFQDLQQKHSTEFSVIRNDGYEEKLLFFCATITSYSKKSAPMKLALFDDYFESEQLAPFWCFQDDFGKFAEMNGEDSQVIEHLYQKSKNFSSLSCKHTIGKFKYVYDFSQMTQKNLTTGKTRPLKRSLKQDGCQIVQGEVTIQCRGLKANVAISLQELRETVNETSSSMTVKVGNYEDEIFKVACDYCVDVQKFPGMLSLKGNMDYVRKVSLYLKEKIVEAQSSCSALQMESKAGPYWEPQSEKIEVKEVNLFSKEGQEIQNEFSRSLLSSKIIKLQRIQNKWLWEKYAFCKQRMNSKNGKSGVNERRLFHGSSQTPPKDIYHSDFGFDFRFGNPGRWGKGAYFASDSNYSNGYAYNVDVRHKQMFLAYVLTGHSIVHPGSSTLDKPPLKPHSTGERYDSVTNGQSDGTTQIFVVYDHDKSYPAYIITYK